MTRINEGASVYPYGFMQRNDVQKDDEFGLFEPRIKDTLPNFKLKNLPNISLEETGLLFG